MTDIAEIKSRLKLSEVIGRECQLKRAGRRLRTLCPFHQEKTPSFFVDDDAGLWHCFGCGVGGDVITWTELRKGVSRGEALALCAGEAGVEVNESSASQRRRQVRDLVAEAAEY